jgi:dihydrofolate reductase
VGRLVYAGITSLDGCIADTDGRFDWAVPDEEVHAFINDRERAVGTYLFGRRMYEEMAWWEADDRARDQVPEMRDFAQAWRSIDKVVYSRTLENVSTARTRIERAFEPDAVRWLKTTAERDLSVGGPELAAHALAAGLVDECHVYVTPVVVGGGKHFFPDGVRLALDLVEEHRFGSGVVHLGYRVRGGSPASSAH